MLGTELDGLVDLGRSNDLKGSEPLKSRPESHALPVKYRFMKYWRPKNTTSARSFKQILSKFHDNLPPNPLFYKLIFISRPHSSPRDRSHGSQSSCKPRHALVFSSVSSPRDILSAFGVLLPVASAAPKVIQR